MGGVSDGDRMELPGVAVRRLPCYALGRTRLLVGYCGHQIPVAAAMFVLRAEMILLAILTVATYSLVGLLAVWGGLGRPHWFLRVAVVGGTLLLLLLIPVYEPVLLFSIQAAVAILPLMFLRAFRRRARTIDPGDGSPARLIAHIWPQFSLLDLLLLPVIVAVAVPVAVKVPSEVLQFWT